MKSQLLIVIDDKDIKTEASCYLKEAIDAAMGIAAFGVRTSIVFMGESIKLAVGENRLKIVDGLEFYEVENLYVFESDLQQGFDALPVLGNHFKVLKDNQFSSLLEQHTQILRMG